MKRLVLFSLLAISLSASAQTGQKAVKNISLEFLGAHNGFGVNYDSRLKGNEGFGYRVGLSYAYLFPAQDADIRGVAVPLEVNYLIGTGTFKFELGFGTSFGYYHIKDESIGPGETIEHNEFGYFIFGNAALRLQPSHGITLRVGVIPNFGFDDKYAITHYPYPYLSIGYAF
jgi:hypothetical protein